MSGPVGLRRRIALWTWTMAGLAAPWTDAPGWFAWAAAVGVVPLVVGWAVGSAVQQPLTGLALFLLLLPAARSERPARGMGVLAVGFGAHCAAAVALARLDPVGAAAVMPDGPGYLEAQLAWIRTGQDPEYDWVNWVPSHLHLLVGMTVLGVASLGLLPLVEGVYECDLMNYYVGNLLAASVDPVPALFLGWHPWSVIRGVCYVVLVYELASLSLQLATGRTLATVSARARRWGLALALFFGDAGVKIWLLDPVRAGLASNLEDPVHVVPSR